MVEKAIGHARLDSARMAISRWRGHLRQQRKNRAEEDRCGRLLAMAATTESETTARRARLSLIEAVRRWLRVHRQTVQRVVVAKVVTEVRRAVRLSDIGPVEELPTETPMLHAAAEIGRLRAQRALHASSYHNRRRSEQPKLDQSTAEDLGLVPPSSWCVSMPKARVQPLASRAVPQPLAPVDAAELRQRDRAFRVAEERRMGGAAQGHNQGPRVRPAW